MDWSPARGSDQAGRRPALVVVPPRVWHGVVNLTEELSIVLTEPDVGGKPNPKRATTLRLAKIPVKIAPQGGRLGNALMQNAWCSSAYTISGKISKERLQFMPDGVVNQTPGNLARWRVQNELLEFSRDGTRWAREPLQLALNSSGSPVLRGYGKEYLQCD